MQTNNSVDPISSSACRKKFRRDSLDLGGVSEFKMHRNASTDSLSSSRGKLAKLGLSRRGSNDSLSSSQSSKSSKFAIFKRRGSNESQSSVGRRHSSDGVGKVPVALIRADRPSAQPCLKVKTLAESLRQADINERVQKMETLKPECRRNQLLLTKSSGKSSSSGWSSSRSQNKSTRSISTSFRSVGRSTRRLFTKISSKKMSYTTNETDGDDANQNLSSSGERLKFLNVLFREYDVAVDDNPSASRGPAISMGWTYTERSAISLEDYESKRPPRRELKEIRMPRKERERRLTEAGFTEAQIMTATKRIAIAKKKRKATLASISRQKQHESMENMKKKLMIKLGRRKSDEQEELDLWANAQQYTALIAVC